MLQCRQQRVTPSSAGEWYGGPSTTAQPILILLIKIATQSFLQKFVIPLLPRRANTKVQIPQSQETSPEDTIMRCIIPPGIPLELMEGSLWILFQDVALFYLKTRD